MLKMMDSDVDLLLLDVLLFSQKGRDFYSARSIVLSNSRR